MHYGCHLKKNVLLASIVGEASQDWNTMPGLVGEASRVWAQVTVRVLRRFETTRIPETVEMGRYLLRLLSKLMRTLGASG